jgi:glycosyltransferase involved in cell wall biosynthesis
VNGGRTVKYGAAAKLLLGAGATWKLVYRNIGIASYWHRWNGTVLAYRKAIIPQMDGVIGVSSMSLEDCQNFYGLRAPSTVILNGISPDRMTPTVGRSEFRRSLGVDNGDIVLLFVGNLDSAKRPDRFLRVLARVRKELPHVKGWIVGKGPLLEETEQMAANDGLEESVRFFGSRSDVANFMLAADIFVITSDSEGIPAVVLEAGLLGLPVVATQVGGLHECVIDGNTGLLVPADEEDQLVDAIAELATDRDMRKRLGQAGQARVLGHLTIEHVAERYLDFYRKLLGHPDGIPARRH